MKIVGEGMPREGSPFNKGDLFLRFAVVFPVCPFMDPSLNP